MLCNYGAFNSSLRVLMTIHNKIYKVEKMIVTNKYELVKVQIRESNLTLHL